MSRCFDTKQKLLGEGGEGLKRVLYVIDRHKKEATHKDSFFYINN